MKKKEMVDSDVWFCLSLVERVLTILRVFFSLAEGTGSIYEEPKGPLSPPQTNNFFKICNVWARSGYYFAAQFLMISSLKHGFQLLQN